MSRRTRGIAVSGGVATLLFFALCLLPVVVMFVSTLFQDGGPSLEAYGKVLIQKRQWDLFLRTISVSLTAVLLSLLVGVPFAWLTTKSDLPLRRLFGSLYFIPLIVPPYMIVFAWDRILSERYPLGPWIKEAFGLKGALIAAFPLTSAAIFLFLSYFPLVILLTRSSLLQQDPSLEEAASLTSGEGRVQRGITLRLAVPGIFTGATFVFLFALSNYGVPNMAQANVYALEVFYQFKTAYDADAATATALPLVILSLVPLLVQRALQSGKRYSSPRTTNRPVRQVPLGRLKIPAFLFASLLILISVVVPLGMLLYLAGGIASYRGALDVEGLGAMPDLTSTLVFSALAASAAVLLGFFMAHLAARAGKLLSSSVDLVSILPFAFPAGVVGIGLVRLWNRPGAFSLVYTTSAILVIGLLCRFSPFGIRTVSAALSRVDPGFEEAARVSGAGWLRTTFSVTFRMALPGLACAWIVVFILSLGELGMSRLVAPPGVQTLPLRIFSLIHWQYDAFVAALCVILVGCALLPVLIFTLLTGRRLELR